MKVFFIWLLICSPMLLVSIFGVASVAMWLANTAIMTFITLYITQRKRDETDS